jgi:integrase
VADTSAGTRVPKRRPQGSGTLAEKKPGVWRLRVFDGRRQVSRTVNANGPVEARRQLAKFVAEVSEGGAPAAGTVTVARLLQEFIVHSRARGRSPKTVYEAERTVQRVLDPVLGSIQLAKLTTRHLDELYRDLAQKGLSPSSIRRYHAVLSAALSQAVRWEWLAVNPAANATLPAMRRTDLEAVTVEELGRLMASAEEANPRFAMLLKLGVLTGARRGELCALRWRDVDLEEGRLTIRTSLYRAGEERGEKAPKSGRATELLLDGFGVELLREWKAIYPPLSDDCFVVSSVPDGTQPVNPDSFSSFMHRLAKKTGVRLEGRNPLRHLAGTELIAAGVDARTAAQHLGHADPALTLRRYAHARTDRRRAAASLLSNLLQQATSNGADHHAAPGG